MYNIVLQVQYVKNFFIVYLCQFDMDLSREYF